jgi:hypothetical protein
MSASAKKPIIQRFNVILTYENEPQEIFDLEMQECENERKFVFEIMQESEHLAELVKISTCLTGVRKQDEEKFRSPTDTDMPKYLMSRSGKFYFTDQDEDTRAWKKFRDSYIKALATKAELNKK